MSGLTSDNIRHKVEILVVPILERAGVELVELNIGHYKDEVRIAVMADLSAGGITIAQCAQCNRAIVEAIDADGFLGQGYSLEFSSPGLDRPLTTAKDFRRNLGRAVRIWLAEALEGKKEHGGVLIAVGDQALTVRTRKNGEIILPLGQIIKAMLVI